MKLPQWITLILVGMFILTGCSTVPVKTPVPKKIALVLGGGGARGFAHVGVIRELEAAGIPIDLIVGVSVGSLIGALYADSKDAFQLEWSSFKIRKEEIFDFKLLNLSSGLARGEALKAYLDRTLQAKRIEDLKIPMAIVAADLKSGKPVVFQSGSIADAVRASTSVPGVFEPVIYGDQILVDGGILGNLAPEVARQLGADIVIGVNIAKNRSDFNGSVPNALSVILESIDIMGDEITNCKRRYFDVLIEPQVGQIGITDFTHKKKLIDAGRQATLAVMDQIKALLQDNPSH